MSLDGGKLKVRTAWFNSVITGNPIYPVQMKGLRHFCDVSPLPNVLALCGQTVTDDDSEVLTTCPRCADVASSIKIPESELGAVKPRK